MSHNLAEKHKPTRTVARIILVLTLVFASLPMYATYATTRECAKLDKSTLEFYAKNNILYYCPKLKAASGSSTCVSVSSGTGDNVSKALGFLTESGYDTSAAAGIIGNLMQESTANLDPYIIQGGTTASEDVDILSFKGGFGIAQWTDEGRKKSLISFAAGKGLPITSLQVQLEFLLQEAISYGVGPDRLNGLSVREATLRFHDIYEASADTPEMLERRVRNAESVAGVEPSDPGFTTTCVENDDSGSGTPVNIDGVNIYNQYSLTFRDGSYNGENSCGPVSFAMAASALGVNVDPVDAAAYAASQGQYVPGAGSSWTITEVLASHYGLRAQSTSSSSINSVLERGGVVHCSGQGPHPFTGGGHFIAIVGIKNGQWVVADSNGGTLSTYDPNSVIPYIQNAKAVYAK